MKRFSPQQMYEIWRTGLRQGGMEVEENWDALEDWDKCAWEHLAREILPDWVVVGDALFDHKEAVQALQRAIEGSGLGSIVNGKPEHEILNQMAASVVTLAALDAALKKED